jgi:SAM-dependent methyltransferase
MSFQQFIKKLLSVRRVNRGFCPICQKKTLFIETGTWLRDFYLCMRCKSIPRWRALIQVLNEHVPDWRDRIIHESSPGSPSSDKLRNECTRYSASQFFPDTALGKNKNLVRCENIEALTFQNGMFDLFITQDVFEHVLYPEKAFREIARVLKPGGAHVFTVPWYFWQETRKRVTVVNGTVTNVMPPEYHGNPIDDTGSLVVTEWGRDLLDIIQRSSGLTTTAVRIRDRSLGIDGKFIDVFISRKNSTPSEDHA